MLFRLTKNVDIVNNMPESKLSIYKFLKDKGLVKEPNKEYEKLLKEEEKKGEFEKWHGGLPKKEQEDFDFIFNE